MGIVVPLLSASGSVFDFASYAYPDFVTPVTAKLAEVAVDDRVPEATLHVPPLPVVQLAFLGLPWLKLPLTTAPLTALPLAS
jgi:hypothetical protein